jgi:molecular chaperone DnaK (HSP70)
MARHLVSSKTRRVHGQTTASVVAFTKHGDRLVGLLAKHSAAVNPTDAVFAFERPIGGQFDNKVVTGIECVGA